MTSSAFESSIDEGDLAPTFQLSDCQGVLVDSKEFLGNVVVLFFYPLDYSPICTLEAIAFREAYEDFQSLGAEVVGISVNKPVSHMHFCDSFHLPFKLLSDPMNIVRNSFGLTSGAGRAGRVTYVIDQKGRIVHMYVSAFRANRHAHEALAVVESLQRSKAS